MRRSGKLGGLTALRKISGGKLIFIEVFLLTSILILGFLIRILPLRWGMYLMEFDPWMQYKEMLYIVNRGWEGFIDFFSWHDYTSWYPYGRDIGRTAFPGLPFMAAFLYHILHGIGIQIEPLELATFFPPAMALVAILFAYLLGKELGGKPAGLLSAFFLAVSRAHIERSLFGWFDDESIGIPLMLIGLWAYINAIKEERSRSGVLAYSLLAGLCFGYMAASWGAAKFPLAFIPLITVLLALIGRYRRQLLIAFTNTFSTYTLIALMVPKLGPKYIKEVTILAGFFALVVLLSFEIARLYPERRRLSKLPYYVLVAGVVGFLAILGLGYAALPGIKFFSVLVPSLRFELPIVISVAENQLSTWAILFLDIGFQVFFCVIGLYYALTRRRDVDVILSLFAIFTIYFASTMIRLTTLAAPAIAILAGLGLSELLTGFVRGIRLSLTKTRIRPIGWEYYLLTPILIIGLLIFGMIPAAYGLRYTLSPIDTGYTPPTIVSAATGFRMSIPAWLKALDWMKENLPRDAVIACWWDYGYWVTIVGNKTSIIDNATLNSTQVGEIGYAFMSNETTAYKIFRRLGATHVLIFVTHVSYGGGGRLLGYGDEGKWIWMLRIARQTGHNLSESDFLTSAGTPSDKFWTETTLGQLIPFKPVKRGEQVNYVYQPPTLRHFRLVYESDPPYSSLAYVYIYEIVD